MGQLRRRAQLCDLAVEYRVTAWIDILETRKALNEASAAAPLIGVIMAYEEAIDLFQPSQKAKSISPNEVPMENGRGLHAQTQPHCRSMLRLAPAAMREGLALVRADFREIMLANLQRFNTESGQLVAID